MIEYGWTFHFWDAFINRQIDSVIVMTHNFGVKFQKPWKVTFNIQTLSLTDILILCPKSKFQKNLILAWNSHTAYVSLS